MPVDKSAIGRTGEPVTMHVERGKIREFARAIKDDDPLYYDEAHAAREAGVPLGATIVDPANIATNGKFDATVFRPSSATWFIGRTTTGTQIVQFGATGAS